MASQLVLGLTAFLPALAILYFVLGAQESFFQHKAMFLALLGGFVLGVLAAIPESFILRDASIVFVVPMFALVETMGKTMLVGLPRFQDENETVLLGGAAGATMAAMLLMFYMQTLAAEPISWQLVVKVAGASIGFTGAHFISGLRLGYGPARGSVLSGFLPSLGWLLPAHVLLGLLGLSPTPEALGRVVPLGGDWIWALPLALYGAAIFVWQTPGLIEKGLPREERRRLRRERGEGRL